MEKDIISQNQTNDKAIGKTTKSNDPLHGKQI